MAIPFGKTSFAGGEIAPSLFGHVDLDRYATAASTLRNMYAGFRGGAYSRAGTRFVGRSKQRPDLGQSPPHLIPFRFSLTQQYVLEFGDLYFRIISNGGFVTEAALTVTAASNANPCRLTVPGHNWTNGDWIALSGLGGMIQLNGNSYIVATSNPSLGTLTLQDLDGNALDSTAYGAYTSGGTAARIYTVTTPYLAADVAAIKFTQSADVMSLCHPNYAPYELARLGPTNWTLTPAAFSSSVVAPGGCIATATTHPSGATTPPTLPAAYAYCATSIDPKTGQESTPSPIANVVDSVDMAVTAGSIKVEWGSVDGIALYNIYRTSPAYNTNTSTTALPVPVGAQFGLIGQSFGTDLVDSNITPDFTHGPPQHRNPFAQGAIISLTGFSSSSDWTTATVSITTSTGTGFSGRVIINNGKQIVGCIVDNGGQGYLPGDTPVFTGDGSSASAALKVGPATGTYPSLAAYFQERRVYAATLNQPDTYFMSQPGAFLNFDTSVPVIDSDAITGTPWSEQVNGIQWMIQMPLGLVTFTGAGVWQVSASANSIAFPSAITPANQIATSQSSIGCSALVQPQKIDWDILYLDAHGSSVRDLTYQFFFSIYTGQDISWPSSHLLQGYQILDWAWCQEPLRILWMQRSDGTLLSLTYVKEQQVAGWARHTTQGIIRGLTAVAELPNDVLYLCAQRFLPGSPFGSSSRYFIERMDPRAWSSVEDVWAVDAGVALLPPTPAAQIYASAASGNGVTFQTNPGVFTSGDVGKVIRMGGGIAVVTAYTSPTLVTGNWLYPCQQLIPDDPNGHASPQGSGFWSYGTPVTTLGGLLHLAGQNVVGLADGVVVGPLLVSSTGFVTLPFAATKVVLGLGFTAQLQAVPLNAGNQPTILGQRKRINAVTARIEASAPCQIGANQQDASTLTPVPTATTWSSSTGMSAMVSGNAVLPNTYQTAAGQTVQPLFTGDVRVVVAGGFAKQGQAAVQQTQPLPLAVLDLVPEILPGDAPEATLSERQQGRQQQQPTRRAA